MWDVSGTGAALQEGFQPGRMLGRGCKGVTLGMAPHIPHLYLYSASHPGALLDLAMRWGELCGAAWNLGCGKECLPIPGRRRVGFVPAQLGCGWDRAMLRLWALHLLGAALVPGSPRVLLVTNP